MVPSGSVLAYCSGSRIALSSSRRCEYACQALQRNYPRIESPKEIDMRPEHDARRAIIREWMSLPGDKRATEEQAAAFAMNAIEKHEFRCSGDRQQRIMV